MFNPFTCRTCSAWKQTYPENETLGDCNRLPVILPSDGTLALLPAFDMRSEPDPTREIAILRTTDDFGCVSYSLRGLPR